MEDPGVVVVDPGGGVVDWVVVGGTVVVGTVVPGGSTGTPLVVSACAGVIDTAWISGTVHTVAPATSAPRLSS